MIKKRKRKKNHTPGHCSDPLENPWQGEKKWNIVVMVVRSARHAQSSKTTDLSTINPNDFECLQTAEI